nr:haloalkane dehalogenase [Ipomoea batatas]
MADYGFHCFAPDWIGFGFSDKPQSGYGFDYTEKEFHEQFDKLLDVLGIASPFFLVVQGFLVGSYGLTWALKIPSKISKLAILNSPLTPSSPIPGLFQQLRSVDTIIEQNKNVCSPKENVRYAFNISTYELVAILYLKHSGIATKILADMRSTFGANDCHLLCINSSADGSAGDHYENPWALV